jgi:signal transduction histidine kinase
MFLAVLSVALWTGGDILARSPYPGIPIQLWNDGIIFLVYAIVIYLLDALRQSLSGLEAKVENRTQALRQEMEERQHLERQILDLIERERQSFGHELHDVICQELASIAIAGHLLAKKLQAKQFSEAGSAREIAEMVDQVLTKTHGMARGFFTAGFDVVGLAESLRETVRTIEDRSGVHGEIDWDESLVISNEDTVVHLFRIAQEAVQNAVKHGKPSSIKVSLKRQSKTVQLMVEDDGKGLLPSGKSEKGLGLRIMAYRAGIIGGEFKMENLSTGGTRVTCTIPVENIAKELAPVA